MISTTGHVFILLEEERRFMILGVVSALLMVLAIVAGAFYSMMMVAIAYAFSYMVLIVPIFLFNYFIPDIIYDTGAVGKEPIF